MIQKLEGLKTTLWTGLAVSLTYVLAMYSQVYWMPKIALIEQVVYGIFVVGIVFTAQFSRSRYTLLIAMLAGFYLVHSGVLIQEQLLATDKNWFYLAAIFVLAFLTSVKDRGLFSVHGIFRLLGICACIVLAKLWLLSVDNITEFFANLGVAKLTVSNMLAELPTFSVAFFILYKSLRRPSLLVASLLTSLILTSLVFHQQINLPLSALFSLLLFHYILVVVIDSYYLAYRDELTGIPSRRALNQFSLSLGRKYCVAMLDVDHFKKFNDNYGHDIGDQVLKLVAAKIMKVTAGGRAFRYGGEEFTIVFPRKTMEDAEAALEHVRQTIADYSIVIRHPVRKSKKSRQEKAADGTKSVSVTISIGLANKTPGQDFDAVIKEADKALYRAKRKGRNNVSQ